MRHGYRQLRGTAGAAMNVLLREPHGSIIPFGPLTLTGVHRMPLEIYVRNPPPMSIIMGREYSAFPPTIFEFYVSNPLASLSTGTTTVNSISCSRCFWPQLLPSSSFAAGSYCDLVSSCQDDRIWLLAW